MSSYFLAGAAAGAPANPDLTYEYAGFNNGAGTVVTAGNANVLGSASASLATTASAWSDFTLYAGNSSTSNGRFLLDISFNGGSTWPVLDLVAYPGGSTSSGMVGIPIQLPVPAGSDIRVRCRGTSNAITIAVFVVGVVDTALRPPFYSTITALNLDQAASGALVDLPLNSAGAFTQIIASTASAYGALLVIPTFGGAVATSQPAMIALATGAAASEAVFFQLPVAMNSTTVLVRGRANVIEKAIPSGTRISAYARATTPGSDVVRVALYGLS